MNIGDKAPELLGRDENGNELKISDFKGKKLVLYFYPKDSTPGCTSEACNLRGLKFFYPSKILCTDNAAMIACRGYYQKTFADSTLNAIPNLGL